MDGKSLLAAKTKPEATLHFQTEDGPASLRIRALSRRDYRTLLEAHPADDDKRDWHNVTFPPALIAACAVEPELTVDEATVIWEEWEEFEADRVFLACYHLNESPPNVALGFTMPGSVTTDGSGQNSTTASPSESPTPNS